MTATAISALTVPAQVAGGRPCYTPLDSRAVTRWLAAQDGQNIAITFAKPGKQRSSRQNRYLWGVAYNIIADHTGHTTEEIHEALKQMFLPREFVQLGSLEREVCKSTTRLSTVEFAEYVDRIVAFAAQELGLIVPLPED